MAVGMAVVAADLAVLVAQAGGAGAVQPAAQARTHRAAEARPVTPVRHPRHAPRVMWVRADVATVWKHPRVVRRVDRPATTAKPDIHRWLSRQSVAAREQLVGRVLTQTLRGERLTVLHRAGAWTRVRIGDQRGSYFRTGIPGWVPTRQLSARPVHDAVLTTTVRIRTGASVTRIARGFLGTPYLWGGMSRAGIDCSGLTYRVFRAMGLVLPRDAADQSRLGRAVPRRGLQRGDLVFFGPHGRSSIHHVGIYAGRGLVLHAPHTGAQVRLTPLRAWSDYWGARRLVHTH